MADLPFEVHLMIPPDDLTGIVSVTLKALPEAGFEFEAGDYAAVQSLLSLFAEAVNGQLFHAASGLPASFEIASLTWRPESGHCEMQAKAENLPAYAWAHLLALLQKNHDTLEPLESVSVASTNASAELTWQVLQEMVLQDFSREAPPYVFEEYGGIDKSKNMTIELEFDEEVSEDALTVVDDGLMTWMQLVILGAFDSALNPADELDPLGEVRQISSIRVQCFLPYFNADMSAFAALENFLLHVHSRFALTEVSIQ